MSHHSPGRMLPNFAAPGEIFAQEMASWVLCFVFPVWSWTLSSRKTSCSPCWGNCTLSRTLRSPLRLTLRRHTPQRPSKNPKLSLKSMEDGNSGSFNTRGVWSLKAVFKTRWSKISPFPERLGSRELRCQSTRSPLLALRTKKAFVPPDN